jgi:hypothetical protein
VDYGRIEDGVFAYERQDVLAPGANCFKGAIVNRF